MGQQDGGKRSPQDADGRAAGSSSGSVSLLELEPELGSLLAGEQLDQARRFALPARMVRPATSVIELLREADAFGAIVHEGLLLHGVQIGERRSLRLLGPGDVVPFTPSSPAVPMASVGVRAAMPSWIVLLGSHFLVATHHCPQLASLMYRRAVESSQRLATQLALSHLSRVDERLMALMWLLAEDWGHVTSAGIRLRLALTHDALGELVGAQRSTVTLALTELAERGSLIRQDQDWVILDPPPEPRTAELEPSRLLGADRQISAWSPPTESEPREGQLALLRAELARLRQKYAPDKTLARELQDEARQLRARTQELVVDARALRDVPDEAHAGTPSASPTER
jgi:CRP/FNR family cyclic AMP-dependent transcriptional regulator